MELEDNFLKDIENIIAKYEKVEDLEELKTVKIYDLREKNSEIKDYNQIIQENPELAETKDVWKRDILVKQIQEKIKSEKDKLPKEIENRKNTFITELKNAKKENFKEIQKLRSVASEDREAQNNRLRIMQEPNISKEKYTVAFTEMKEKMNSLKEKSRQISKLYKKNKEIDKMMGLYKNELSIDDWKVKIKNRRKEELEKAEPTKAEQIKTEPVNAKPTKVEEIKISPDNMVVFYSDINGNSTSREINLNEIEKFDDEIEKILEEYNFEQGTEAYDRVDPRIVQALSNHSSQLIAYLKACQLDSTRENYTEMLEEIAEDIPQIEYELRDIRKVKTMDFEDKSFVYKKAKQTQKMFRDLEEDKCQVNISLLDKATLFIGNVYRTAQRSMIFIKNKLMPKEEINLLEAEKKCYKEESIHGNFVRELREQYKIEEQPEYSKPEQKSILQTEATKIKYTKSDGDVRDDI